MSESPEDDGGANSTPERDDIDPTVYVNDGINETDVYHSRAAHATRRRWTRDNVEEVPLSEALGRGLRPCKQCDPPTSGRVVWIDGDVVDPEEFDWQTVTKKPVDVEATRIRESFSVATLEGTMQAEDAWLVRGVEGELYPVDPDIFAKTYIPDPTKPPDYTDEDVLAVKRALLEEATEHADGFRGGMEHGVEEFAHRLLEGER